MRSPSALNCHIIRPMSAPGSVVASPPNKAVTAPNDNSRRRVTAVLSNGSATCREAAGAQLGHARRALDRFHVV